MTQFTRKRDPSDFRNSCILKPRIDPRSLDLYKFLPQMDDSSSRHLEHGQQLRSHLDRILHLWTQRLRFIPFAKCPARIQNVQLFRNTTDRNNSRFTKPFRQRMPLLYRILPQPPNQLKQYWNLITKLCRTEHLDVEDAKDNSDCVESW